MGPNEPARGERDVEYPLAEILAWSQESNVATGPLTVHGIVDGEWPIHPRPCQVISATIDGIGTLTMPAVAGPEPKGLTGAQLPPVRTYRRNQQ